MKTFEVSNKSEHDATARRKEEDVWNQSVSCVAVRRKWVLLKSTSPHPVDERLEHGQLTRPVSITISWRNKLRLEETHRWRDVTRTKTKRTIRRSRLSSGLYLFVTGRRLMERSCRHRCTGDKPTIFFLPNNEESEWRSTILGVPRCQMRLPYLIMRCAKWCHRHICVPERLGAIKWPCARPYDRESICYQRSEDARWRWRVISMTQFEKATSSCYRNSWFW